MEEVMMILPYSCSTSLTPFTVSCPASAERSKTATLAPSCASFIAPAAPMPLPAPVTTATRPSSLPTRNHLSPRMPPDYTGTDYILRFFNFDNPRLYPNRTYVFNADRVFVCVVEGSVRRSPARRTVFGMVVRTQNEGLPPYCVGRRLLWIRLLRLLRPHVDYDLM